MNHRETKHFVFVPHSDYKSRIPARSRKFRITIQDACEGIDRIVSDSKYELIFYLECVCKPVEASIAKSMIDVPVAF